MTKQNDIGRGTVGKVFIDGAGRLWTHKSFGMAPVATFHQVGGLREIEALLDGPELATFRLATADELKPKGKDITWMLEQVVSDKKQKGRSPREYNFYVADGDHYDPACLEGAYVGADPAIQSGHFIAISHTGPQDWSLM